MRKIKFMLCLLGVLLMNSCSSDESEEVTTKATIMLLDDSTGNPYEGFTIYAFSENTWSVLGTDKELFADFTVATDQDGVAVFENLGSLGTTFTSLNAYTNTFKFKVNYTRGNESFSKVLTVTFKEGVSQTKTMRI